MIQIQQMALFKITVNEIFTYNTNAILFLKYITNLRMNIQTRQFNN